MEKHIKYVKRGELYVIAYYIMQNSFTFIALKCKNYLSL